MIVNMEKLAVYCLSEDKEAIIAGLMKLKCVQLTDAGVVLGQEGSSAVTKKPADAFALEQEYGRVAATLKSLSPYKGKGSLFAKRKEIQYADYGDETALAAGRQKWQEAEAALQALAEAKARVAQLAFQKAAIQPWTSLDLPVELNETKECRIQPVILPQDELLAEVELELETVGGQLFAVSEDAEYKYSLLIYHKNDETQVAEAIKLAGILKPDFDELTGLPAQLATSLKLAEEETAAQMIALEETLGQLAQDTEEINLLHDSLSIRLACRKAEENLVHTQTVSVVSGWVPVNKKEKITKYLEHYQCYYTLEAPETDEEPPILLKNSKLMEPFEAVTEMYSLPLASEVDPSPLLAPFFFIFFGMMLSDAAYGLLLVIGGTLMLKLMDLSQSTAKLVKLLVYAGISTTIFGFAFGGFFGDIITVVADVFFGKEFVMPALLNPLEEPMTLLVISCALGLVHLFYGMAIQAYMLIKRGKWLDAVFDIGFWYFTIIGLGLLALEATRSIGTVLAVVGVLGLLLTQGREKPTLVGKLIGGLGGLYNITGYISDILSYSRILALGLATGVIAQVINLMGSLPGKSVFGVILLLIVFPLGHALNLAINALGAYVHSSRLQYVEFFGKFYEGGGKPFTPLKPETKYTFALSEEEK